MGQSGMIARLAKPFLVATGTDMVEKLIAHARQNLRFFRQMEQNAKKAITLIYGTGTPGSSI
ncbi:MAG: hypothetical protein ACLURV_01030 [Gallintestinimicrobium sp.]